MITTRSKFTIVLKAENKWKLIVYLKNYLKKLKK